MRPETIRIRRSEERGHRNRGWLDARFTFSFSDYQDPEHMGFRTLRVLNEDTIEPGRGFGPHGHRDMEILTYMLEGSLRHRDSTGEERVLGPNEVQAMSAGTGIVHSEFNASDHARSRSIQIWIEPVAEDLMPAYQQIAFDPEEKRGRLRPIAVPRGNGEESCVTVINQDARVFVCELADGNVVNAQPGPDRHAWIQVLRGTVGLGSDLLRAGDGAAVSPAPEIVIRGVGGGEFLLFDLS